MIYHNFRLRLRISVHIDINSIPIELAGFAYPEDAKKTKGRLLKHYTTGEKIQDSGFLYEHQ